MATSHRRPAEGMEDPRIVEHALNPRRQAVSGRVTRTDRIRSAGGRIAEPVAAPVASPRQQQGISKGEPFDEGVPYPGEGPGMDAAQGQSMDVTAGDPFGLGLGDIVGVMDVANAGMQGVNTGMMAKDLGANNALAIDLGARSAAGALLGPGAQVSMSLRGIGKGLAQEENRATMQEMMSQSDMSEADIMGEISGLASGELSLADISDQTKDALGAISQGQISQGKAGIGSAIGRGLSALGLGSIVDLAGDVGSGIGSLLGAEAPSTGTSENPELSALGRSQAAQALGRTAPQMMAVAKSMTEKQQTITGRPATVHSGEHWSAIQDRQQEKVVPLSKWLQSRKEGYTPELIDITDPRWAPPPPASTLPKIEKFNLDDPTGGAGDQGSGPWGGGESGLRDSGGTPSSPFDQGDNRGSSTDKGLRGGDDGSGRGGGSNDVGSSMDDGNDWY